MGLIDYARLCRLILSFMPFLFRRLGQRISAIQHKRTYVPSDSPRNVVIIGGSFGGAALCKSLCETLPSGWRVTLVERNSHMHYTFAFPRYSVVPGYERNAFIPYDTTSIAKSPLAPEGVYRQVRGAVADVTSEAVVLVSGETLAYDYLVVATGASQPFPARLRSTDKESGCSELQSMQQGIREAGRIAVVGAGPVGVELATDIKSYYPEKEVTLVHSRGQLLNNWGKRLHDHVLPIVEGMGIKVILKQRPEVREAENGKLTSLEFPDGRIEEFDLVLRCTGQTPNSQLLQNLSASSISPDTKRILVKPTLQVTDPAFPQVFALGDVAETGGAKMARAALIQADVVSSNINSRVRGTEPNAIYHPQLMVEGALKLTLGKDTSVVYTNDEQGTDILLSGGGVPEDFDIARGWGVLGAKFQKDDSQQPQPKAAVA
ncbi:FAD/NAD(P)-binding domain-containing protein [Thozetella sp. PMI_491]|nr:FAD/NAD(P)-binding domain-containing protein [Thozetella sp. PMI_491]